MAYPIARLKPLGDVANLAPFTCGNLISAKAYKRLMPPEQETGMQAKTIRETAIKMAQQMQPSDANPMGNVHGGVIMKNIDSAAGSVAIRHARSQAVTASIDRLDFFQPVYVGNVLVLKAGLNMVGTTSMEVGVRVEAEDLLTGKVRHAASAYLTFVALGEDGKPRAVPPLELVTDEEKRRHREAIERRHVRLAEKERERSNRG